AAEPARARWTAAIDERAALRDERAELAARLDELSSQLERLPGRIEETEGLLGEARTAVEQVSALRADLALHARIAELRTELTEARKLHAEAREIALQRRGEALDLRQARLEGMAAELAGALAVGADCPVCGSVEHPHKATAASDAPDAEAERAAQRRADDASAEEHARQSHVRDLETRLQLTGDQLGDADPVPVLTARLAEQEALAAGADALAETLERCRRESAALAEERLAASSRRTGVEAELSRLEAEISQLRAAVDAVLAGSGASDLGALILGLGAQAEQLRADRARLEAVQRTRTALAEADRALAAALGESGFATVEQAAAAALAPDVVEELTATVKHHDRRLAVVRDVLGEPGADRVLASEPPGLEAALAAESVAQEELSQAQAAVRTAVDRLARLGALGEELGTALRTWAPVRDRFAVADRMTSFVEGKSADNALQMSLSAYVVAYRLTQVVAAANERLAVMSESRYALEHSAGRAAGDRRGGLALPVRDDWSGEARDPSTLSGGESFVVSLALALGLADVITAEAGGAMLETLFVDEGFGSLDADTLEDVLDVLDGLRDGGRVVGVVSHVAEMRDRIPTRLVITKHRAGSRLAVEA
ncbi:MAG: SbcC/MukB-like Walker B domain-containing protein, partial [Nocardioides sp.]